MHPFLERLIDLEILERKEGRHPRELRFHKLADCGEELPGLLTEEILNALRGSVDSANKDDELATRLKNAYADSMGYYRHTSEVTEAYMREARRREEAKEISDRWLSLVHPPSLPYRLDVLNLEGKEWCHPCDSTRRGEESFLDLWEAALPEATRLLHLAEDASAGESRQELEEAIGTENLNDGLYGSAPCRRKEMDPLPLRELYDTLRSSYDG
jgi:hypothetical protein